jgi:hypothetical protein
VKRCPGSLLLLPAVVVGTALALASCSSIPQITVPKEVRVSVPVPCVDPAKRPQRPALAADDDLLAMDSGTRTLRTWRDRELASGYVAELEAVVEGCSRIPASPPNSTGGPPR